MSTSGGDPIGRLLLALLGSPLAWTLHLLLGYVLVVVSCSVPGIPAGIGLAVLTAVCAGAAVASGVLAVRLWRESQRQLLVDREQGGPEPWDARMGERGARSVFLAVLALFMAVLFTYLILLQGLPSLFTSPCPPNTGP
jgi:hypothetical protein